MNAVKIKYIFSVIRNGANIKQSSDKTGYPITRIETIVDNQIDYSRVGFADVFDEKYTDYYLSNGDILMSHINSVTHLGKVGIVKDLNTKVIHGMNLIVLKSNIEIAFPKYLYRYFITKEFRNKLIPITKKSVNQASFNISDLKEIEIPLPPYANQIRIANVLGKIEDVIKARKNAIAQLDELVKATFYDMFGDPVKNEKGWKKEEIKYFGKVITGNTPKRNINEYYDNQYIEWVKTDNIESNKIYLSEAKEYLSEFGLEVGRFVEEGGLLINCIAGSKKSIGKIAIANRKVAFNQQINAIQLHQNIEPLFMYWLINISNEYIQSFASGTMKFILSKSAFEKIELIKPEPSYQIEFAIIAEKIEKLKDEQEKQLLDMEALYTSVSHEAFSDKLDLSRIPYDESLLPETFINITPDDEVYMKLPKSDFGFSAVEHYGDWKDLSFSIIADIIKKKFKNHYFNAEMLLDCLQKEENINVAYYTSAEKKKKPELDNDEDFYGFMQSTLTGSNPFLELDQVFYDAEKENISDITFREIDLDFLDKKSNKKRSGIYFRIKNETTSR